MPQRLAATQPMLAPPQPSRPTKAQQIHQLHHRTFLHHRPIPTLSAAHPIEPGLEVDHDRLTGTVIDGEHVDIGQTDQQLTDSRRG